MMNTNRKIRLSDPDLYYPQTKSQRRRRISFPACLLAFSLAASILSAIPLSKTAPVLAESTASTASRHAAAYGLAAAGDASAAKEAGRFLVRFAQAVPEEEILELLAPFSAERIGDPSIRLYAVAAESIDFLRTYFGDRAVSIEPDGMVFAQAAPNDPYYSMQWALSATRMPQGWSVSQGSDSVLVAVIDSGVDRSHADLAGAAILPGKDFTTPEEGGVTGDLLGHGTETTGIIAAVNNNAVGICGVCWDVTVLPLRVFTNTASGYVSDVCDALYYAADEGADVINMSFGTGEYSEDLAQAVAYAVSKGCIMVASAGNEGTSQYNYPASLAGVISVASVDSDLLASSFSNYNYAVDVAAPGEDILTTTAYVVDHANYVIVSGTSFSAPYVAGIAALAKSLNSAIDSYLFDEILEDTCADAGDAGYDTSFGYGIVNAEALLTYVQGIAADGDYLCRSAGGETEIIGYSGTGGALTIPSSLNGYPVTGIGDAAFAGCPSLQSVVIPDGVAAISDSAFEGCSGLAAAYFLGNAPALGLWVFLDCQAGFTAYYLAEKTGFSSPDWNGWPSATFEATHTVIFEDWDGTVLDTQEIAITAAAAAPSDPSRTGYTFTGWDAAFDNITADLTVTAQYSINHYTVTFQDFDGTVLDTQTVDYGGAAAAPADPSRAGHTFVGWDVAFDNITADLTVTAQYLFNYTVTFADWDGTPLSVQTVPSGRAAAAPADPSRAGYTFVGWDVAFDNITADLTVTAQYLFNYTVTFLDWDGTPLSVQTVPSGRDATAPADPSRTGYTFAGWDIAFDNVAADLTVTAQYTINRYTVTFLDWDGSVLDTQTVDYGGTAEAPADPSREGYTFIDWDAAFDNITADLTVTALYLFNYTVTFVDWDGTPLDTQTVLDGRAATAPADPSRAGYTFVGWDVAFDNVTSDLTVTAQYLFNYIVTFKDYDGTVLDTQTVPSGRAATAPADPSRAGYTFIGWDVAFDNVASDLTVTAQYLFNYTVTFVDWDGTPLDTQTVPYGRAATAPADPSRIGYTFAGWDVAFNNVTSDLTATAQYTLNRYTVAFDSKGGSAVSPVQADHGEKIAEPAAPSRIGYIFGGWYKDYAYAVLWDFAADAVTSDTTLVARWTVVRGDVTGDGKVDGLDLLKVKKYILGQIQITGDPALAADVNGDGKIDGLDLLKIKKYILGQIAL